MPLAAGGRSLGFVLGESTENSATGHWTQLTLACLPRREQFCFPHSLPVLRFCIALGASTTAQIALTKHKHSRGEDCRA